MLRHKGVFGEMDAVDRSVEPAVVMRRFPEPRIVKFRRDGEMEELMQMVKKEKFVEVQAAVGAGKSTKVPLVIARSLGCVVIHTIPFHIAAQFLADYLIKSERDGSKFVYMNDLTSDMPTQGVVLMSTSFFHARHAYDKFAGVTNAVLYLDESHESDAWTATLRSIAPAITSFRCVIKATATSAPGATLNPDLPSTREVLTYSPVDVAAWSAYDKGAPWSASRINANTMICVDRAETRRKLAAQYTDYGFAVRDCSAENYDYFRKTMNMLTDSKQGIVVVLVDYKFRSSFSIPGVATFIDSCEVQVPAVVDGAPAVKHRPAYDFEVQQFLGRGARLPGQPAVLYRSATASPKMMCDLELLECDAANLLYRLFGFRPPMELIDYEYFDGKVPVDIASAMASSHPLRLCPEESRVDWVNGHLGLRAEKEKEAYEYDRNVRGRDRMKTVSCHTVLESARPITPPPPVPKMHRVLHVDVDGLDRYNSSRESSPSPVFTLDTSIYDHVSASADAAVKPKRVAKRVLEARAAEEAEQARREIEKNGASRVSDVAELPVLPVDVQKVGLGRHATTVARRQQATVDKPLPGFPLMTADMLPIFETLRDCESETGRIEAGKYYHYHGMEAAPDRSMSFVQGIESVVKFGESPGAISYVAGLLEADRLFAVRALVDGSNTATAIAMAIQRLIAEVAKRPPAEWESIVDHAAMRQELVWMTTRHVEEKAKVRVYQNLIPLFAGYKLDEIAAPLDLEQRIMLQIMERFDRVAKKKETGIAQQYLERLNMRSVAVRPQAHVKFRSSSLLQ